MKLVSGGQSGVDRAVLDVAIAAGVAYEGWCPKGGWAEDFPVPPGLLGKYPGLRETPLADPAQRTEWNVRDADACLVIVEAGGTEISKGTAFACDIARRYRKPLLIVNSGAPDVVNSAAFWLRVQQRRHGVGLRLAIGGPRESEAPGIYARAVVFVRALLQQYPP